MKLYFQPQALVTSSENASAFIPMVQLFPHVSTFFPLQSLFFYIVSKDGATGRHHSTYFDVN
jgi:hypothetical protein